MVISFALGRVIKYNTNRLKTSNVSNDNFEPIFYIDFIYQIEQEFKLEDQPTYLTMEGEIVL